MTSILSNLSLAIAVLALAISIAALIRALSS